MKTGDHERDLWNPAEVAVKEGGSRFLRPIGVEEGRFAGVSFDQSPFGYEVGARFFPLAV